MAGHRRHGIGPETSGRHRTRRTDVWNDVAGGGRVVVPFTRSHPKNSVTRPPFAAAPCMQTRKRRVAPHEAMDPQKGSLANRPRCDGRGPAGSPGLSHCVLAVLREVFLAGGVAARSPVARLIGFASPFARPRECRTRSRSAAGGAQSVGGTSTRSGWRRRGALYGSSVERESADPTLETSTDRRLFRVVDAAARVPARPQPGPVTPPGREGVVTEHGHHRIHETCPPTGDRATMYSKRSEYRRRGDPGFSPGSMNGVRFFVTVLN